MHEQAKKQVVGQDRCLDGAGNELIMQFSDHGLDLVKMCWWHMQAMVVETSFPYSVALVDKEPPQAWKGLQCEQFLSGKERWREVEGIDHKKLIVAIGVNAAWW